MANTLLTVDKITRKALFVLHQELNFVGNINRQYDNQFAKDGGKIGSTLRIRLPNEFTVTDGATMGSQDVTENKVDLTVATQKHVPMNFTDQDLTLHIDDFTERFIRPAMSRLAAEVEADALNMYKDVPYQVDNIGSPMGFRNLLSGSKKLTDLLAPRKGRCLHLNTQDNMDLVDVLKGLYHPDETISKQFRDGMMGNTARFGKVYENTLIPRHTCGAGVDDSYLVNGASQTGSSLTVDGGTSAIKKGDVLTLAGVNRVHPETKTDTGELQQFVVTADYAGGAGSISIYPAITTSGASQTVTASPADNAAITFHGTASTAHGISLGYHKDAFAFVTADLEVPNGTDFAYRSVIDGISLRVVRDYDINNDKFPCRVDILYGYAALKRNNGVIQAVRYAAN